MAGIEVLLPALLRINSGSADSFTDAAGNVWAADSNFVGERLPMSVEMLVLPRGDVRLQASCMLWLPNMLHL